MAEFLLKQEKSSADRFDLERGGSLFFFISLTLFLAALVALGGLILLNRSRIGTRDQIVAQNQAKEENLRPELLSTASVLDKRLRNLRVILGNHIFLSNVLKIIEQDTHPHVRFTNFAFTADSRKADMSGEAANYSVLSRQINILERDPQVERVEFGGLSTAQVKFVGFKMSVIFKPTLLGIRP